MLEFEWDESKEKANLDKHGISFLEAAQSFFDPDGFVLDDHAHSENEKRHSWIGKDTNDRVLTTYFTLRERNIRIIGCGH